MSIWQVPEEAGLRATNEANQGKATPRMGNEASNYHIHRHKHKLKTIREIQTRTIEDARGLR